MGSLVASTGFSGIGSGRARSGSVGVTVGADVVSFGAGLASFVSVLVSGLFGSPVAFGSAVFGSPLRYRRGLSARESGECDTG